MTKKIKTKGTDKYNRSLINENDPTTIPGVKTTRTIANLEKHAHPETKWKTNRLKAVSKVIRKRYPIHNGIMMDLWNIRWEKLTDDMTFVVDELYSDAFLEEYIDKYRRSFRHTPLEVRGLNTHTKQLLMFDADIEYFKETFFPRWKRWATIELGRCMKEGIIVGHENCSKHRKTSMGTPNIRKFYRFANNPGFEWKSIERNELHSWIATPKKPLSGTVRYAPATFDITTTETFMVSVFDIPLPMARQVRQSMPGMKSFAQYIADGKALSLISPEQFMEIREIITSNTKNRHMLAMQTLHEMLKEISAESESLNKKPRNLVEKKTPPSEFVDRALLAETLANWIVSNKELLNKRPKVAAFVLLTAIEDGDIKW